MRTKKSLWIIIAAFALCATPIQAQGFGSILKKAKKVLTPSSEPAKPRLPKRSLQPAMLQKSLSQQEELSSIL